MSVVDASYGNPLTIEERAVMSLAGGIAQLGYQCGMLWGASLAAGARAYQVYGENPKADIGAIIASQRIVAAFAIQNKYINCSDITELDWNPKSKNGQTKQILKFFLKGGPIGCFAMAGRVAPMVQNEINTALANVPGVSYGKPFSCASLVVDKICASPFHATMAAGLAGGIGLSGAACGALGAAIWMLGSEADKTWKTNDYYKNPKIEATIERFLAVSNYELECAKIAGRKFESTEDHAKYIQAGGCAKIIEALSIS
jgi:hypothetical protein